MFDQPDLVMNNIKLKTFLTDELTKKIGALFSIEAIPACSTNLIKVPTKFGTGKITTIDFDNGLNLILVDVKLKSPITLNFAEGNINPLIFLHCQKGAIIHKLCNNSMHYQLDAMRSSITSCPTNSEQELIFPADKNLIVSLISVDRKEYTELSNCHSEEEHIPEAFVEAISDDKSSGTFFYQGKSDYQLSKSLSVLFDADTDGLEDFIFAESNMFDALGHFIRNYKNNQNPTLTQLSLSQHDIECLHKAKDVIITNLNNAPTIPELAKMVGINQQKLKKGFKTIFGTTVNQFLIQKRMEAAKILLSQKGTSIRDVATQVGYSNQSHFSSKFRERFGMLPKDFVKSVDVGQLRASMN